MSTEQKPIDQTFCSLLVDHVLAMETDAHFQGHPEWQYIVVEAKQASGQTKFPTMADKLMAVMRTEYRAWCKERNFDLMSAEDLLVTDQYKLTSDQRRYLIEFIEVWEVIAQTKI